MQDSATNPAGIQASQTNASNVSHTINLIDTPGHADFTFEVLRSLRVLDGAICILDGVAGVEAQTEKVWYQANAYQIPRIIYVNKLDRDGAAFGKTIKEIAAKLHVWPAVCQLPWYEGGEGDFVGVVDVVELRALRYASGGDGKKISSMGLADLAAIEPELANQVMKARNALVELLSEHDDDIVAKYLEHDEDHMAIPALDLLASLRRCALSPSMHVVPVFAGASFRNIGVQPILDAVIHLLPSPAETPDPQISLGLIHSGLRELVQRSTSSSSIDSSSRKDRSNKSPTSSLHNIEACALAFKVVQDPKRGILVYVRTYHGAIKRNALLFNTNLQLTERVPRLLTMYASDAIEVDSIPAGQIGVISGLKHARTGDTLLCYSGINVKSGPPKPINTLQLSPIAVPPPVFFTSIEPERLSEEKAVREALAILLREDPSLHLSFDEDSGQILLSGMGELHLEIAGDRLINQLKAKASMGKIEIGYRECVLGESDDVSATFEREVSGKVVKAGCTASAMPYSTSDSPVETPRSTSDVNEEDVSTVISTIGLNTLTIHLHNPSQLPQHLPREQTRLFLRNGALSALARGPSHALPLHNTHITLTFDPTLQTFPETTPSALSSAAQLATRKALEAAHKTNGGAIVEPVMNVAISVDEASLGGVVHDLSSSRSAMILSLDADADFTFTTGSESSFPLSPPTSSSPTPSLSLPSVSQHEALSPIPVHRVYAPPDPFDTPSSDYPPHSSTSSFSSQSNASETFVGEPVQRHRTISARVPLREMLGYLKHLRSLTRGRGTFSMEVGGFERVSGRGERVVLEQIGGGRYR